MLTDFLRKLGLFEQRCCHCQAPWQPVRSKDNAPLSLRLCQDCQQLFTRIEARPCRLCGLSVPPPSLSGGICASCRASPPPWVGMSCYGPYAGALRDVILRLKFDGELNLAALLAELLLQACACLPAPDLIVPIPQYPSSLRKRGFNQAAEVGKQLAKFSGLKLDYHMLKRIRPGAPQESLGAAERRINLKDAFTAEPEAANRRIWILDDVVTTGSTCRYATEALLAAGAGEVYIIACARTSWT